MNPTLVVVGLGYVGLPLAVQLSHHYQVIGLDLDAQKIEKLKNHTDPAHELSAEMLENAAVEYSSDLKRIAEADVVFVAVPTPVNNSKQPDLTALLYASQMIGENLKKGSTVCYESTVYPGATEDECIPVLERCSGLLWQRDFFVGYSPERINPGDTLHSFEKVKKLVSGDCKGTLELLSSIYSRVVKAGVFRTASIKVAEAAKVVENIQRDINIALMNELRIIFDKSNISTEEVIAAAASKWNFVKYIPGLVGGHCISVDPYYMIYHAEKLGIFPEMLHGARKINSNMASYFATALIKKMLHNNVLIKGSRVVIWGITFKENVSDIRNSQIFTIVNELKEYAIEVDLIDPHADPEEVEKHFGFSLKETVDDNYYDAGLLAVPHREFLKNGKEALLKCLKPSAVFFDIKEAFDHVCTI